MSHVFINRRGGNNTDSSALANQHFWTVKTIGTITPIVEQKSECTYSGTTNNNASFLASFWSTIHRSYDVEFRISSVIRDGVDGSEGSYEEYTLEVFTGNDWEYVTYWNYYTSAGDVDLNIILDGGTAILKRVRAVGNNAFEVTVQFADVFDWEITYEPTGIACGAEENWANHCFYDADGVECLGPGPDSGEYIYEDLSIGCRLYDYIGTFSEIISAPNKTLVP